MADLTLTPLPYGPNDLTGFLSADTLHYHHDLHLKAYVDNTNRLKAGTPLANLPLEEIITKAEGPLFNNAAQVFNHEFYFSCLSPKTQEIPAGLRQALEKDFGSAEAFTEKFTAAAAGNFGSGWTWLVSRNGSLEIMNTQNAGTPLTTGAVPLLTVDVWEHAYYLDYQNRRPEYVSKFMQHINWEKVSERLH